MVHYDRLCLYGRVCVLNNLMELYYVLVDH